MCPVCILTIGGGIIIARELGWVSLAIFILTVLVTVKILKDREKKPVKANDGDMFGEFNTVIKKILHCCGK